MSFDSPSFNSSMEKNFSGKKIAIIRSLWNKNITDLLLQSATNYLKSVGFNEKDILIKNVPGSMELVYGCNEMIEKEKVDGVIALGCVIKGETDHDQYISNAVSNGLVSLCLKYSKPVIFGVLTTNNLNQAIDRCGGKRGDKGLESAKSLVYLLGN
tara:strand:- start:2108 stop:2575 length:468 start_codon:yes stop_codon:yes gene_type:complete